MVRHGGWAGRATDPGDIVVLELDHCVERAPAEFATPSEAYGDPPRRLLAYGFPKRYDEGTLAEYRATTPPEHAVLIASSVAELTAARAIGLPAIGYARSPQHAAMFRRTTGCAVTVESLAPLLSAVEHE
ncbi:hypothetical protein [Streptomyces sp. TRM68367]|uniref:hypothetical protein n=1 Tax=Streptomyces sp. TRM68367 TaxID=2758415 RepID=UPI00165B03F1|nr:hypothetical protein [Streptomyces sp. TRM68367]MBC9724175.1 hypothetical protein [Streptomyces sp. TRM68367]